MPSPATFHQELKLWQCMWQSKFGQPLCVPTAVPNITKILHLLLITAVTLCGVERANSSLRFVKSSLRSSMGEDRFNALMLLYVHKNIDLKVEQIITTHAHKHPRRMLLLNPLDDEK